MGLLRETIKLIKIEKKRFVLLFTLLSFLFVLSYITQDRKYISSIKLAHNSDSGSSMSSGFSRLVSSIGISNNSPVKNVSKCSILLFLILTHFECVPGKHADPLKFVSF